MAAWDRMSPTNIRIGLLHHVGGGNLGDDATLASVAENIRRRLPRAEIIVFSMNPDDTEARHGIPSRPVRRTGWSIGHTPAAPPTTLKTKAKAFARTCRPLFHLLKVSSALVRPTVGIFRELSFLISSKRHIKTLNLLIISGGGQFTERDGPWEFPYTIFKWVMLARWVGVRCIFLNVGAGPLTGALSKYFARQALAAGAYVSLRDHQSRSLVAKIGFKGSSLVYPDSAYALRFTIPSTTLPRCPRPIVGLAPMHYPESRAENEQTVYENLIVKLADFALWLLDRSYALRLLATDTGVDPVAVKDLEAALMNHLDVSRSRCRVSPPVVSVRELLTVMAGVDFVITCRFHGVIFAHLLNKPVLALAHHPKVSDLMTDLGLSNYCVDIRDFDPTLLAERFALMVANAEGIKSHMAASLRGNRQRLADQLDGLFDADSVAAMAREPRWTWRWRNQTGGLSCR